MAEKGRLITPGEMLSAKGDSEAKMTDLAYQRARAGEQHKKNTPIESTSAEQNQKAEEILEEITSAHTKYDISQAIKRAEAQGISLIDTVDEAYAEVFDENDAKKSEEIEKTKNEIRKNQIIEMVMRRFEPFLTALDNKRENEILSLIEKLPQKLANKIKRELIVLEDTHTENVEKKFRAYIEPFVASTIVREQPQEMPGLLHIGMNPVESDKEDKKITDTRKKRKGISGFFGRLFG